MSRQQTLVGSLARLGVVEPSRAAESIVEWPIAPDELDSLLERLPRAADPDEAVHALGRLFEVVPVLAGQLSEDPVLAEQLIMVLGGSHALGQHLVAHPEHLDLLGRDLRRSSEADLRARLLTAVDADPDAEQPVAQTSFTEAIDRLRLAYRAELLRVAARDLVVADPTTVIEEVSRELSDLADATVVAALAIARAEVGEDADQVRLAIIGLGKGGAQELNYISDVDVMFVAEPVSGDDVDRAVRIGTRLAAATMRACSAHTSAGSIWELDAALRPEGKAGPLVRSLTSMRSYYDQWAKTWEFQALLKARPIAGDLALGEQFCAMAAERVWRVAERKGFVEDVRAMRRRVLDHIPSEHETRELKLGAGGLRDVEFSVQLLQLVHGRADERLRSPHTLEALRSLVDHGYVGREDGAKLAESYRFIRTLEHRIQLDDLRRTHLLPTDERRLRALSRELGLGNDPSKIAQRWRQHARRVRRLHRQMFYSQLLTTVSRIRTDHLRLTTEAAADRLQVLGFDDPKAALEHVGALTAGVSRQAEIQRQLLPAMLGWLGDGPNPDHGLLAFRQISESLGRTPWYLRALRDEGMVAQRLATLLSSSRYAVSLLRRTPEAVQMLAKEKPEELRGFDEWRAEMTSAAGRQSDPLKAIQAVRGVRQRGLLRIAAADVLGVISVDQVGRSLTELASATIDAALAVAARGYDGPPIAVIAMGRWGGREMSYASDADAMFAIADGGAEGATSEAGKVITRMRRGLAQAGPVPPLTVDPDLRPEGKGGPMVRSLAAYRAYYQRWSSTWELQALVRASALAGDAELGTELITEIDRHRWPEGGLSDDQRRDIRRIKARMEAERLPRGIDRRDHLKLGPGGLSDVEWTVQMMQLDHGAEHPELRNPATMTALATAERLGLIDTEDAMTLATAWRTASRIRDLSMLVRGRPSDAMPSDTRDLAAVAELMGYPDASASHLASDQRRIARQADHVVDRLFWGESG